MGWGSFIDMQEFCHRCAGELPAGSGESPFCPHCGAPQLSLSLENQSVETGGEQTSGGVVDSLNASATAGTMPPPNPQQVDWKTAIRCAAVVAGVAAVLSLGAMRVDALTLVSSVWIMSASLITLSFYQKWKPAAWMDARVGARIGVLVGVSLALALAVTGAGAGLVMRYGLHSMSTFDAEMMAQVQKAIQQSTTPVPQEMMGLLKSPEFRAGMMLVGMVFSAMALLLVSTLGGAFAGLMRTRRKSAA